MQATTTTITTKKAMIKRSWHHVDAKGKVLGRIAAEVAHLLMGKNKSYFVRNLDCGDYVVLTNAKDVVVTGRKEDLKVYYRHSMYPGGFKAESLKELRERKPEDIIIHAVKGMIPQNKLRASMLKRLMVFSNDKHSFSNKLKG